MSPDSRREFAVRLRAGTLIDAEFDAHYPPAIRDASASCWSPLAVVWRAVDLLRPAKRVLDVGSGSGKFCIAASILAPAIAFSGIERRSELVVAAVNASAELCKEPYPVFFHGGLSDVDAGLYDGYFLFNPFGYNSYDRHRDSRTDEAVERRDFLDSVRDTESLLDATRCGSRVVTCNGFGGEFGDGFYRDAVTWVGDDRLEVWVHEPQACAVRAGESPPVGLSADTRARMLVEQYHRLPVTRQGRIGVQLGLLTEDEYQTCSRSRVDEYVFTRALTKGLVPALEKHVYGYAPRVAVVPPSTATSYTQ